MISFAVTAYNESLKDNFGWIKTCVETASKVDLIQEIIIADDHSTDSHRLFEALKDIPKVRLFHNGVNLGVLGNKIQALKYCSNNWVQLCDSDDTMEQTHFDRLEELRPWKTDSLYCNSWGKPKFRYQSLVGTYDAAGYVLLADKNDPWQGCQFNTGNHFFPRQQFLDALRGWERQRERILFKEFNAPCNDYWRRVFDGADSAFYNSRWLLSGAHMQIVDGLEYTHRYNATATGAYYASPPEKEQLPPTYLQELRKYVGVSHE